MSVQSVKNSVIKQGVANPLTGTTAVSTDAGAEFSELLQQVGNTYRMGVDSTVGAGGLTAAIKQSDAASAQAQADGPRDRKDTKDSRSDDRGAERSDAAAQRPDRAPRKTDRDDPAAPKTATKAGPQTDATAKETAPDAKGVVQVADAAVDVNAQLVDTAAVFDPTQMVNPAQVANLAGAQSVQVAQVQAVNPALAQAEQARAVTVMAGQGQAEITDPALLAQQQSDAASLALQGMGAKTGQKVNAANGLQQQAEDLAQRLDDPSAQLDITVSVTNQAKVTDVASVAQQVSAAQAVVADEAALQDIAAQSFDPKSGQASNPAQAPLAANPAAAQANAAAASPMAMILAAQAEAAAAGDAAQPVGTQNSSTQNAQPVAGIGAASGTQSTAKPQAAQTAQAARPHHTAKPEEVTEQIAVQITQNSANGTDTIKVQLKPVELGAVEVKMEVAKDGTVNTIVTVDSKETLDLMKKDQQGLEKALQDAGLKTENGSLTFNLRGENQQQSAQDNRQPRRSRLSVAAAADAASAQNAAQAQARWTGRSGVNISV